MKVISFQRDTCVQKRPALPAKGVSLAVLLLLSASFSFGQTALATITGTIADSTGAVIADAPVTVRNHENGAVFSAASSSAGVYTVAQLPIGDYDLTVAVPGFKTYNHSNFHLASAQIMREDITLDVGQTTESVTVTADASLLKTESTEVSQNVTLTQLNNLPILAVASTNSGFRDPFSAVRLVPGVQYANGSNVASGTTAAVTTMVINGTPANTYQTRLDGMTMNPTGPRLIGAQMQTQPSVDAVQEVSIETSNFAAEFGTAGGAMINMTTKSGTNTYHGSAYDYGTNEALNAHQPYTGFRSKVRQTDYGFTFGGPVRIPKVYNGTNKTFFFFSYEQYRQVSNVIATASVPTAAYRVGDFSNLITAENKLVTTATGNALDGFGNTIRSGTIFDPRSTAVVNGKDNRLPFVGNQIPVSLYDPVAAKILALVPNPQGSIAAIQATNNYTGSYDTSRHSNLPSIKLDQNLGTKGRLSFYLQETNTRSPRTPTGADPLPAPITRGVSTFSSGTTVRLNYDYTATSRLILHFGAGWNDSDFKLESDTNTYDAFKQLGLTGQRESRYFPAIVTGVNTNNTQIGGMNQLGSEFPTASFERRPSGTVSASYVAGRHTFKFGGDWRMEKFPNYVRGGYINGTLVPINTTGSYSFGQNYTQQPYLLGTTTNNGFNGFELASFLLGGVSRTGQWAPTALSNSKYQLGFYAQDTWKVTRKLTLDYGIRWDYGTYAHEQFGRNASLGLAVPNPSAGGRLGASQFEATCQCNFATNYPLAFGPRLGAAYQVNSKTVFRAGIGVVYNATSTASGAAPAGADSGVLPANSGLIVSQFQNGMPASSLATWPSFNPGVGQGPGTVVGMPALLDPNAGRPARLLQWSVGLQREVTRNLVVEGSYVGNRGSWWTAPALAPLNSLSQDTLRKYGFNDFTSASESALLTTTIAGLTSTQRSTLASRGVVLPYANFPTSQTVRQSLLDYPQYTGNGLAGSPLGKTWYDSFQLNVTQRFTKGLSLNMNYVYSKNLALMSSPDVYNRSLGKNLSVNDVPQQLRLTVQYQVPQLHQGSLPFVTSNKMLAYALSGWGIGAYTSYQSAPLVPLPTSNNNLPISNFLGRGPGSAQLKQNADGSFMNPWSVDWTDYSGKHHTDPLDINCHCFDVTKTQVLNPNAWTNIPNGQWGAIQSSYRGFRGFRTPTENANFSRNFRFGKDGRFNLNVRAEFNNIFNRMLYGSLTTPINAATNFATNPTTKNGLYTGGFGTIIPTSGVPGQRTGTYVARLTF